MGNAYRDNKVYGNVAMKACEDLIAEGGLAAVRVGDYEESLPRVAISSRSQRADARALKRQWGQGTQAKNDDRNDREPTQPRSGGCMANATISAYMSRAAPTVERIMATLLFMLHLRVRALDSRRHP